MEISVLSQDQKWKQVKVTDVFITNKPKLESVLILSQPWFQKNAIKVDFPNKTLTFFDGTSYEGCKGISEEVMKTFNPKIKIEYPNYSDEKWSDSDLPLPIPMFTGTLLNETNLISALSNCIRNIGRINPNHLWFTNNFT
ncbi:3601_t:CDS:2 [Dentiscutata erythropus]|uniref:3601_t:CDS:1 n=1 Tax=Dentiscutata erythropus TaxID=1348616 RepID=A0A9N8ZWU5_9GLOM|nr:3601_t:CDS:2 [Dentiscutata erythropus]